MIRLRELFRDQLRRVPALERHARLLARRRRLATEQPDWTAILAGERPAWEQAVAAARGGPRVLMATSVGSHLAGTSLESALSAALTLRGAEVDVLLCNSMLPACLAADVTWYPDQSRFAHHGPSKDLCHGCFDSGAAVFRALGIWVRTYGEYLTIDDRKLAASLAAEVPLAEIPDYTFDDIAIGEHALAGALRFYARATLEGEPEAEPVLRRYFGAALLTSFATRALLRAVPYEVAVFHHGIYVPQGLIGECCRQAGVRVVNWNPAYRKQCFIFSHGDTYHHTLLTEPTETWEHMRWSKSLESRLLEYLESRWRGTQDWIWFHDRPMADLDRISREVGTDFSKPSVGLLTNVMWDAQLHYPANAFPNMLEWVVSTIEWFARRPDLQLIIRVHPAELRGGLVSRQPIVAEIRKRFPTLPPNVFIIGPESQVSTYAVMSRCNAVLIYGTKTGVELTSIGIPVIVAGEAWIRNKGLTTDAATAADYFALLARLPLSAGMSEAQMERARRYAFHFFFRRMIPLEFMQPSKGDVPYRVELGSFRELGPGRSRGLDVICDGILFTWPFTYPAETEASAEDGSARILASAPAR
jgi:capsular polysaccharide biosynthesis protein